MWLVLIEACFWVGDQRIRYLVLKTKNTPDNYIKGDKDNIPANKQYTSAVSFHPDYTVGDGI